MPNTNVWRGGALNTTAQIDHATPGGTIEADDVFNMTLTGENGDQYTITYTGLTTVQGVVEGLKAAAVATALNTDNLWSSVICTEDDAKVIIRALTAGIPFHLTVETTELGGGPADLQTFVRSASVLNVGANDYGTAENWSLKAVPVATDLVKIPDTDYDILYDLDQSAVALGSIEFAIRSKTSRKIGDVGQYLHITAAACIYHNVGRGWLNIDGLTSDMIIRACGKSGIDGTYGLNLLGSNAGDDIEAKLGSGQTLGIAAQMNESCVFGELRVIGGMVYVGSNTGLTTISADGGCVLYSKEDLDTLLELFDATGYVDEGTPAIITVRGGVCYLNAVGTFPQIDLHGTGRLDASKDKRIKTVTACNVYSSGCQVNDPNGVVVWSNGWNLKGSEMGGIVKLPTNMNWPAPSAL